MCWPVERRKKDLVQMWRPAFGELANRFKLCFEIEFRLFMKILKKCNDISLAKFSFFSVVNSECTRLSLFFKSLHFSQCTEKLIDSLCIVLVLPIFVCFRIFAFDQADCLTVPACLAKVKRFSEARQSSWTNTDTELQTMGP